MLFQFPQQEGMRLPKRRMKFRVRAGVGIIQQTQMRIIQRVFHLRAPEGILRQRPAQGNQRAQIEQERRYLLIPHAHIRPAHGIGEIGNFGLGQGLGARNQMEAVGLQIKRVGFPRLRILRKPVAPMVAVGALHIFGSVIGMDFAVHPQRGLIKPHMGIQKQGLPFQRPGHGVFHMEPAVFPLAAPALFRYRAKAARLRDCMQGLPGLIKAPHLRFPHRDKHAILQGR